jgi:hypothetical protein
MSLVQTLYYQFGQYTDPTERQIGLFFKGLSERKSVAAARAQLLDLMQRDLAAVNLWTEYKYKGYKYLRKSTRKRLYNNLERIAKDFDLFYQSHQRDGEDTIRHIHSIAPHARVEPHRIQLLLALTDYFSLTRGLYEYRESSSFSRLLRDPGEEKLVGDCNQIVTLYAHLYAKYFDIHDLKVRLLPRHVALHYGGVDIETTNGTFANYDDTKDAELMPIEELVTINLLDTTDAYLETHEVDAEDFLQSSRLAYMLSYSREIVSRNLDAAYGAIINRLMSRHNYVQALKFAKQSSNIELLAIVGNNGALYHMDKHEFATARKFARYSLKRTELIQDSYRAEGVYQYNQQHFHEAMTAFRACGDRDSVRKCYAALFFDEQSALPKQLTSENIKQYSKVVHRMNGYAKKSENKELIQHVDSLRKYL